MEEEIKIKDSPCYQCLCISICRHKTFFELITDCNIIDKSKVKLLEKVLKPTIWEYNPHGYYNAGGIIHELPM